MQEKNKINKNHRKDLWIMRNMTFKEMLNGISNHPDLKFLITAGGIWWLAKMILFITIFCNVIYYAYHIFHVVLN